MRTRYDRKKPVGRKKSSQYTHVSIDPYSPVDAPRWKVHVGARYLGTFKDEEQAAWAADEYILWSEFQEGVVSRRHKLNFTEYWPSESERQKFIVAGIQKFSNPFS